ncbi:response regulator transcription factor [Hansschlegelia sp. KR7-227]|jgi:FixJ family two-component response regulator|uniref:response regulator transcription factor n=1 Tax=Hansschlegelia sp. KR7-227 TaxID=3400914 RepID=UPI003C09B2B6
MTEPGSVVYVIDDDAAVRASLESLLKSVGQDVRTFASTKTFVLADPPVASACLVLDVRLPGQSGIEFQRELALAGAGLPIVFISGHGDIPMSVAAMKAGAVEFLTKPFRHQDLLDAVHRALEIDRVRRATAAELQALEERFDALTQREREIMGMVAAGRLNKQIAADLQLSEITVKVHRGHLMRKMNAGTLPDLVRMWDRLSAPT